MTGALGAFVLVTPVQASGSVALNGPVTNTEAPAGQQAAHPWTAIIPVRSLTDGKSRLEHPAIAAHTLIEAFVTDVVNACLDCPQIRRTVLVSPDPSAASLTDSLGCEFLAEPAVTGINEAIVATRSALASAEPVIAILGDTPCLTGSVLTAVLQRAEGQALSFVPDAAGTGSTMWCSTDPTAGPHFGHHSRARHREDGAIELGPKQQSPELLALWARARRDVDTDVDLWDACRLGTGPATTALIADSRVMPGQ
jgi:2-phospho-L-lactate guanylyltransferase